MRADGGLSWSRTDNDGLFCAAAGGRRDAGTLTLHAGGQRQRVGHGHGAVCTTTAARPTAAWTPSAPQTFTITVTAVNDAPSFTKGADQTVLEDAGAQSVAELGDGHLAPVRPNESRPDADLPGHQRQRRPVLRVLPAIDATGTLTYTPAANANGVRDGHGAAAGQRRARPTAAWTRRPRRRSRSR